MGVEIGAGILEIPVILSRKIKDVYTLWPSVREYILEEIFYNHKYQCNIIWNIEKRQTTKSVHRQDHEVN